MHQAFSFVEPSPAPGFDHVWFWHAPMDDRDCKGLLCRVLKRGGRNSILVEYAELTGKVRETGVEPS